jgi:hypothetical protein
VSEAHALRLERYAGIQRNTRGGDWNFAHEIGAHRWSMRRGCRLLLSNPERAHSTQVT